MLDHLLLYIPADLHNQTVSFYEATLAPLGYKKTAKFADGDVVGFGEGLQHADFWVTSTTMKQDSTFHGGYVHLAFRAKDTRLVDECHAKGLQNGGKDNGAPGERPMYGPTYYSAFLLDPAGNNIEVVKRED